MKYPTQKEIIALYNEQYDRVAGKKAGDTYINEDGVLFTIFTARKGKGGREYTSYTFDIENANTTTVGKLNGKKVAWEHITIKE